MTTETEAVLQAALLLPTEARLELVAELLQSLDASGASVEEVETVWGAEIEARVADLDAGRVTTIPREVAESRMFAAAKGRREAP